MTLTLLLTFGGGILATAIPFGKLEQRIPAPVAGAALAILVLLALVLFPRDSKAFI